MANNKNRIFRLTEILHTQDVLSALRQASIFLVGVFVVTGVIYLVRGDEIWGIFARNALIGFGISLILLQLVRANKTLIAAYATLILFGVWLFSIAWDGAGVQGTVYTMLVLVVIGAGLFIGRRAGYLTALTIVLSGFILLLAGRAGWLVNLERPITDVAALINTTVTFFLAAHLVRLAIDQVERALGRAQNEIKERIAAETALLDLNSRLESMVEARTVELIRSQAQYKLIADNVSDLIWTMDLNLKMSYTSPSVERFLGYKPEEIVQLPLDHILTPASLEFAMSVFAEEIALANKRPPEYGRTLELEYIHKDGSTSWNEARFSFLRNDGGNPVGLLGVSRNIDKRRQAETALQESEARFHGFFTHSMDAMFLLDENGMIVEVNPATENLFQFDQGEVIGKPVWEVQASRMPEEQRQPKAVEMMRAGVEEATRTGQASWVNRVVEGEIQRPDGSLRQIQQTTFVIPLGERFRLASIVRDATESKKTEAFRTQAETEKHVGDMRQRLLDFSRDLLANVEDVTEILEIVRTTANELVPHDIFSPYQLDESDGVLCPMETHGHPWFSGPFFHDWKIPLGQGIIGEAARKGQALMVNNSHLDPRSMYPDGIREQIKVEHSIAIPIHSEGRMTGMLVFLRRSGKTYSQEDFETLQLLASFAELAITNANIFANLEQRVAERTGELRANERRFRALFERSNDAVSLVGLDGKYIMVNQKGLDLLGFTEDEMRSTSITQMPNNDEKMDGANKFAELLAGTNLPIYERRVRTKDGRELTVEVDATLVRDDTGNPTHIQMISHNITERKQIETERERLLAELTASNKRYRVRANEMSLLYKLGNSLAAGQDLDTTLQMLWNEINQVIPADAFYVAIYDEKTDIVNYPIFFYFGNSMGSSSRKLKEEPGLTGKIIFEKRTLYLQDMTSRETLDKYEIVDENEMELRTFLGIPLVSKDGVIGMLSVQSKQVDAYSPEQIKLMESIATQAALAIDKASLLDRLQDELVERRKLVHELEKKNEELERFTYTVSHDLKAPLVTIRGFLGYLEKDIQSDNPQRIKSDMDRIASSTDKMQKLLEGLLKLSRAGRTIDHPQTASLETIVRDAINLLEGQIDQKGVQVVVADGLPEIYGDPARLIQVLQNLIDNAVKFMGNQPNPKIETGQREDDADGNPVFFVRDNGMGIAPEHLDRVFGLFDKLDSQADGTGIGLATVKRIIETHGGMIWVESEGLGKGSTFCFTIPDNRE